MLSLRVFLRDCVVFQFFLKNILCNCFFLQKFEFDSGEVASGETSAADRSDAPSRIGQETGGSMPPEGQQQQTGGTSRQNVTGPASVPPLQTHQNGGAHETGGPMSFPGPAMNGHHENGDVKRFKME